MNNMSSKPLPSIHNQPQPHSNGYNQTNGTYNQQPQPINSYNNMNDPAAAYQQIARQGASSYGSFHGMQPNMNGMYTQTHTIAANMRIYAQMYIYRIWQFISA